jgi:hypothetical protein
MRSRSRATWENASRSRSAMVLKEAASCPISSSSPTGTAVERSPPAIASALCSMRFRRRAMSNEAR